MMKIEREEKKEEVPAEEMNDDDGVKRRQGKDLEKGSFFFLKQLCVPVSLRNQRNKFGSPACHFCRKKIELR